MTTSALITMLVVQITVTAITAFFLIRTLRKTNHKEPINPKTQSENETV